MAAKDAVQRQATAAETRGWQFSEKNNADNLNELAANGMKIDTVVGESPNKKLRPISDPITAYQLTSAGLEGAAITHAYNRKVNNIYDTNSHYG